MMFGDRSERSLRLTRASTGLAARLGLYLSRSGWTSVSMIESSSNLLLLGVRDSMSYCCKEPLTGSSLTLGVVFRVGCSANSFALSLTSNFKVELNSLLADSSSVLICRELKNVNFTFEPLLPDLLRLRCRYSSFAIIL